MQFTDQNSDEFQNPGVLWANLGDINGAKPLQQLNINCIKGVNAILKGNIRLAAKTKRRHDFTLPQKIAILKEIDLDASKGANMRAAEKYGVSHSLFRNWRKARDRMQAANDGMYIGKNSKSLTLSIGAAVKYPNKELWLYRKFEEMRANLDLLQRFF